MHEYVILTDGGNKQTKEKKKGGEKSITELTFFLSLFLIVHSSPPPAQLSSPTQGRHATFPLGLPPLTSHLTGIRLMAKYR